MRNYLALLLVATALSAGGCNILAYPMYAFAPPPPMKTVHPEYPGMEGKHVAIVVFAGPETQLDYQQVELEMFDAVSAELRKHIKDITLVDPRRVMRYQEENPRWRSEPPERLCKVFTCDVVLLISLMEFATREPGSIHLARGRITAEASVYEPARGGEGEAPGGCQWRSDIVRVVHPPQAPVGLLATDDWRLRIETERIFAAQLAKSFYKHKVPKES
jgi:hypothetical protein